MWDKVFVFHSYMPPEKIDAQLGFHWRNSVKDELEYNDGFNLVVFVRENRVFQYARVPANLVDWDIGERNGFKPTESIFRIEHTRPSVSTLRINTTLS
jgi:hypothetical protein